MKLANGANNLLEIAIGHAGSVQSTKDTKLKKLWPFTQTLDAPEETEPIEQVLNRLLSEGES